MNLKNGAEYIESLRKIYPIIYYKGQRNDDLPYLAESMLPVSLFQKWIRNMIPNISRNSSSVWPISKKNFIVVRAMTDL